MRSLALLLLAAPAGCKAKAPPQTELAVAPHVASAVGSGSADAVGSGSSSTAELLAANNLQLLTSDEANARVAAVFPTGVATENAHPKVTYERIATPVIDPTAYLVAEVQLAKPHTAAEIKNAFGGIPKTRMSVDLSIRNGTSDWVHVWLASPDPPGTFDRVAIQVSLLFSGELLNQADATTALDWLEHARKQLDGTPIVLSMPVQAAIARAKEVQTLARPFDNMRDIGVTIVAPAGKPFPLRLAWDAMYSAGFQWGDGDYMRWSPSDHEDGISADCSIGMGYWMPEDVAKPGIGTEYIGMSFDLPRASQPERMLAAMEQDARYLAKRLGGKIFDSETHQPLDEAQLAARVAERTRSLTAAGLPPGSNLTSEAFL
ncbi:MAG TPA: hypothetical protein VGM90_14565 [Kofleriaceae bacterium]|jgi:hypothetical protein